MARQQLRQFREKHGLTLRDVQEITTKLARRRHDPRLRITVSRLSDIEAQGRVPSIYCLAALAFAYGEDMRGLLRLYGVPA